MNWRGGNWDDLKEVLLWEGSLTQQDIKDVDIALPDIVRDTTKTEGASLKLKRILGKLGKDVYSIAIKVITDIASETAKKTLGIEK